MASTIEQNRRSFRRVVKLAWIAHKAHQQGASATLIELAAQFAIARHTGIFASNSLERLLWSLSSVLAPEVRFEPAEVHEGSILHVASQVVEVGGLSRMIRRWAAADRSRSHSLALTRQGRAAIPPDLRAAIEETGGQIVRLDDRPRDLMERAGQLRRIGSGFPVVVQHTWNEDCIPSIAFSAFRGRTKLAILDHADHLFWLGSQCCDAVIALRASGREIAISRRGVATTRALLVPIPLDLPTTPPDRANARRQLGIAESSVVLLSLARGVKFRDWDGMTYAERYLPLFAEHPELRLVIVGAGERPSWHRALGRFTDRLLTFPETPSTSAFFDAADIYVDSFPFVSITSLLEASLRGLPCVSRHFFKPGDSDVLATDAPGLDGILPIARDESDFKVILSDLIADPTQRTRLGEALRAKIHESHTGMGWSDRLRDAHASLESLERVGAPKVQKDVYISEEPDSLIEQVHGRSIEVRAVLSNHLPLLSFRDRTLLRALALFVDNSR